MAGLCILDSPLILGSTDLRNLRLLFLKIGWHSLMKMSTCFTSYGRSVIVILFVQCNQYVSFVPYNVRRWVGVPGLANVILLDGVCVLIPSFYFLVIGNVREYALLFFYVGDE